MPHSHPVDPQVLGGRGGGPHQSDQLSVQLFCSSLLTFVAPLLLGCLNRDFPVQAGGNEQGSSPPGGVARHVSACLQLVECAVDLMECDITVTTGNTPGQQEQKNLVSREQVNLLSK